MARAPIQKARVTNATIECSSCKKGLTVSNASSVISREVGTLCDRCGDKARKALQWYEDRQEDN